MRLYFFWFVCILFLLTMIHMTSHSSSHSSSLVESYQRNQQAPIKRNQWILSHEPNGHSFAVLPISDAPKASSLLGTLSERITRLITVLHQRHPSHIGVQRLFERWTPQLLVEGRFDMDGITSYTVNKGERIVLCLRSISNSLS